MLFLFYSCSSSFRWLLAWVLIIAFMLLSCQSKNSQQELAELNCIEYLLESRKDILVLDSAEFGPVDLVSESDSGNRVRFRLPYFTHVVNNRKIPEPRLVQLLLDSELKVVRVAVLRADGKK